MWVGLDIAMLSLGRVSSIVPCVPEKCSRAVQAQRHKFVRVQSDGTKQTKAGPRRGMRRTLSVRLSDEPRSDMRLRSYGALHKRERGPRQRSRPACWEEGVGWAPGWIGEPGAQGLLGLWSAGPGSAALFSGATHSKSPALEVSTTRMPVRVSENYSTVSSVWWTRSWSCILWLS